jgi:hypothetical protein
MEYWNLSSWQTIISIIFLHGNWNSDAALQDFLGEAPLPTFVGEFSLSLTECTKYLVSECTPRHAFATWFRVRKWKFTLRGGGEWREERGATPLTCYVGWRSSGQGSQLILWGRPTMCLNYIFLWFRRGSKLHTCRPATHQRSVGEKYRKSSYSTLL